jgi:AcrR family transcriptional regulator
MAKTTSGKAQSTRRVAAPSTQGGTRELDGRVRRSRDRVLTTAFELLGESGVGGFSVDEVARRSGVAKTTIYRHWPTREALVIDACSRISDEQEVPDTGALEGDLAAILTNIGHLLGTARWSSILPSIVDVAERDPEFADIHRRIQHGHAAPLREVIDRAAGRGEIAATADRSAMIAELMGPLFYRRWFSREPIDNQFVKKIVSNVISGQRVNEGVSAANGERAVGCSQDAVSS